MSEFATQVLNGIPQQGRLVDENAAVQNVADLARKLRQSVDPFGMVRTTEYQPIFSTQPLSISVINDRTFTSGTASITVTDGEYVLSNPGGETCRLETGQRGRYQPGLIGLPGCGIRRATAPTGTTVYRWGYFDTDDGFGFREDADGLATFVRRGGTETYSKPRNEWLDPLDGTGPSGRSFDILDGHVFRFPFAWYGYGTVDFGIVVTDSPDSEDEIIIVDRWSPSQDISFPNPNLPVSMEITGDSAGELRAGGRQYGVFGQLNLRRRVMGELRTDQAIDSANGFIPLISARVRTSDPWRRVPIQVEGISLQTDTSLDWIIVLGATLNQSTWGTSQFTQGDSSTDFELTATSYTGGEIVAGPSFVRGGSGTNIGSESTDIPSQDVPVGEPATLAARAHSGTGTVRSALRMAELR